MTENRDLLLKDDIRKRDLLLPMSTTPHKGFRTQISYENELGETLFTENSMMVGGGIWVLEKLFGVKSSLQVQNLNEIMGIANGGVPVSNLAGHSSDHIISLFGVGIGGAGDSVTSVKDVNIKDRELIDMVPFRVTPDPLSTSDRNKYWFRKALPSGETAYYLKSPEVEPKIYVLWKDGEGDEDGSQVTEGFHNSNRVDDIEVFVEQVLKINKTDIREWFELQGTIEETRINTIGLFAGVKGDVSDDQTGVIDYKDVRLISKLNIPNEILSTVKELTVRYRVYSI